MYKTYKQLNLPEIDKEIIEFWEKNEIFKKSIENRSVDNNFVFYEGPPSANGKPGIHHVMARTIKDLFCRYQSLKGKRVERKGGWDTHGLPIELSVEKELGITKEDIGTKISVDDYNKACKETVMRYKGMWDDITTKMGYWVDLDDPYITFKDEYIESVWNILKRLYDKGLLYKGYTVQPFSPAAGTGLSTHELNQPGCYSDVTDTTAVAQFKVEKDTISQMLFEKINGEELYFLAWTTTPWTLPSNTALTVGAKIAYVIVETFNPYTFKKANLILAEVLLGKWFKPENAELSFEEYKEGDKKIPFKVKATFTGKELEGIRYEQLLPYGKPEDGDAFRVILGDFVTTEDGTGIVHTAPSFGADDMMVGKKNGIGSLTLVDKQGRFTDAVTDFAGRYVKNYKDDPDYKDVNVDIVIKLKQDNKCFNAQKYVHSYPHCWRTDKPVLYYPLDSWFVKSTAYKDRMFELNKTINWKPKHTGEGRFGKWLENLQDWNLSRSRFWGIPLPIWRTADGEKEICIGSIEQLSNEIDKANKVLGTDQKVPKDLHRPYIDDVILVSDAGEKMVRELDLIDVWFDSGSMPYAQWHYPFENQDKFQNNFPADFIAEGVDQTRGWFFTLHAIAVMAFDSVAYKNVVSNGLVQDKNGKKMSKRLGNAVEPFETIGKYGADATRWYMVSSAQPWDNLKFDVGGIDETRRKFFGTLYNTYSFFSLYANIDNFSFAEKEIAIQDRPQIDQWILSLLNSLIKEVDAAYADYEPTIATRKIQNFVLNNLSNWYVRLCRRRFWKGEYELDKISAYQTLYLCMETVAQLMSPVAPMFSDWLFKNLNEVTKRNSVESVHLTDFPVANEALINKDLELEMDYAQRISSLVLSLRKKDNLRVRQPLQKIMIPVLDEKFGQQVDQVKHLILSEVNIKEIEYLTDTEGVIDKKIKPNFRTLGRKLGKNMKNVAAKINQFSQNDIAQLEKEGKYTLSVDGTEYHLDLEDFEITAKDIPGWKIATDGPLTVALDITITDELAAEGMARELVNRIQNIRKSKDFVVTDNINIKIQKHASIQAAVDKFGGYICKETLALSLVMVDTDLTEKMELLDGVKLGIEVTTI